MAHENQQSAYTLPTSTEDANNKATPADELCIIVDSSTSIPLEQQVRRDEQDHPASEPDEHRHTPLHCPCYDAVEPWMLLPKTRQQTLFFLALWGCVVGGAIWLFVWGFPRLVDHVVDPSIKKIQDSLDPVLIGFITVVAVALLPIVFLTHEPFVWLVAMVFNLWEALILIELGTTLGMIITFLLARKYLRGLALRFLARYRHTQAMLLGVQRAGPFKVVLLMRLGPVPYPVTNYICAVPKDITFLVYAAASIAGKLPGNVLGIIFGRNIKGLAALLRGEDLPTSQLVYTIVSLVSAILIVTGGYIYARRALRQLEEEAKATGEQEPEQQQQEGRQQQEQEQEQEQEQHEQQQTELLQAQQKQPALALLSQAEQNKQQQQQDEQQRHAVELGTKHRHQHSEDGQQSQDHAPGHRVPPDALQLGAPPVPGLTDVDQGGLRGCSGMSGAMHDLVGNGNGSVVSSNSPSSAPEVSSQQLQPPMAGGGKLVARGRREG